MSFHVPHRYSSNQQISFWNTQKPGSHSQQYKKQCKFFAEQGETKNHRLQKQKKVFSMQKILVPCIEKENGI